MDKLTRRTLSMNGQAYVHLYLTGVTTFLGVDPKDLLGEERLKKLQGIVDTTGDCESCGSPDIYCKGNLLASLVGQDPEPFCFTLLCNNCGVEYSLDYVGGLEAHGIKR